VTAVERLDQADELRAAVVDDWPLPWEIWPAAGDFDAAGCGANSARGDIVVDYSTWDEDEARRLTALTVANVNDQPKLAAAVRTTLAFAEELERPVIRPLIARTPEETAANAAVDAERRRIALVLQTRIDHALEGDL